MHVLTRLMVSCKHDSKRYSRCARDEREAADCERDALPVTLTKRRRTQCAWHVCRRQSHASHAGVARVHTQAVFLFHGAAPLVDGRDDCTVARATKQPLKRPVWLKPAWCLGGAAGVDKDDDVVARVPERSRLLVRVHLRGGPAEALDVRNARVLLRRVHDKRAPRRIEKLHARGCGIPFFYAYTGTSGYRPSLSHCIISVIRPKSAACHGLRTVWCVAYVELARIPRYTYKRSACV